MRSFVDKITPTSQKAKVEQAPDIATVLDARQKAEMIRIGNDLVSYAAEKLEDVLTHEQYARRFEQGSLPYMPPMFGPWLQHAFEADPPYTTGEVRARFDDMLIAFSDTTKRHAPSYDPHFEEDMIGALKGICDLIQADIVAASLKPQQGMLLQ